MSCPIFEPSDEWDAPADQEAAELLILVPAHRQPGLVAQHGLVGIAKPDGLHGDDIGQGHKAGLMDAEKAKIGKNGLQLIQRVAHHIFLPAGAVELHHPALLADVGDLRWGQQDEAHAGVHRDAFVGVIRRRLETGFIALQRLLQPHQVDGLGEEVHGLIVVAPGGEIHVPGQEYIFDLRMVLAQVVRNGKAAGIRHINVQEGQVDSLRGQDRHGFSGGLRTVDIAGIHQGLHGRAGHPEGVFVVVYNQDIGVHGAAPSIRRGIFAIKWMVSSSRREYTTPR